MRRMAPRGTVRHVNIAATYYFNLLIIICHRTAPYVVKFSSHSSGAVRHTARAANITVTSLDC
uniref:Uncharacterized protein n=1 Tax=Romanomermis culicivorax TaxID=13658 RepID=A0A915JCS4_ROMCU